MKNNVLFFKLVLQDNNRIDHNQILIYSAKNHKPKQTCISFALSR